METTQAASAITVSLEQVQTQLSAIDKIEAGFAALSAAHPANLACDVATTKGMKEAIAGRAAWRDPRIATEKARKAAKAPVLDLGRAIDARAADLTARLLEGEANYDDQIKAEEARKEAERQAKIDAEVRRVADIQARIAAINVPPQCAASTAAELTDDVLQVEAMVIGEDFQEFRPQAEAAKGACLVTLRQMRDAAVAREIEAARIAAEREELAKLRAEQETRAAAERDRIAAEQRAEAQRLAAQRDEIDRRERAARADIERQQAEAAALRRAADEQAARERAEADRQAAAARAEEQERLTAERAQLQRQQDEAAEARRKQVEAEELAKWNAARAAAAAQQRLIDAEPLIRAALTAVRDDVDNSEASLPARTKATLDVALEAIGEITIAALADIPF